MACPDNRQDRTRKQVSQESSSLSSWKGQENIGEQVYSKLGY